VGRTVGMDAVAKKCHFPAPVGNGTPVAQPVAQSRSQVHVYLILCTEVYRRVSTPELQVREIYFPNFMSFPSLYYINYSYIRITLSV